MPLEHSPRREELEADRAAANGNDNDRTQHDITTGDDNAMAALDAIKLPPFWKNEPELWFIQADARFHTKRIRSDESKYYAVVGALDADILYHVSDVIRSPPDKDKYEYLKSKLINRFTDSQEQRLHKLLTDLELGDKKLTQLLRKMKNLAGDRVADDFLHSL